MTVQILLGCRCQEVISHQLTSHQKSHQWCLVTLLVIFTNYYASPHPNCNCSRVPTPNLNGMGHEDPWLGLPGSPPVRRHQQTARSRTPVHMWRRKSLTSRPSFPLIISSTLRDPLLRPICLDPNLNPPSSHCQIWPPKEGPKLRIDDLQKKKKTSNCSPMSSHICVVVLFVNWLYFLLLHYW